MGMAIVSRYHSYFLSLNLYPLCKNPIVLNGPYLIG